MQGRVNELNFHTAKLAGSGGNIKAVRNSMTGEVIMAA
jgi:hypothetical protein